jgi:hypothetical protein
MPAEPAVVGANLASLAESHAPSTIRRRLAALGKMHRFNDLAWNPAHRDIQEPLRGLLRQHGQAAQTAAPLTLTLLRRLLATCARPVRVTTVEVEGVTAHPPPGIYRNNRYWLREAVGGGVRAGHTLCRGRFRRTCAL